VSALVTRPHPPLVVAIGPRVFAWIQNGWGFLLDERSDTTWRPLVDAVGIGGTVLKDDEVAALVATHGRPT